MNNMKKIRNIAVLAAIAIMIVSMTSCNKEGNETIALENGVKSSGFPTETKNNPSVTGNTNIPNIQVTPDNYNGNEVIRIDMTGIQNHNNKQDWIKLWGTGNPYQNIWVEVDGIPQGIIVVNLSDMEQTKVKTDIVFTVDNSGSMSEEADTIAGGIKSWASFLTSNHLDVQFGIVGYGGYIDGAMNLTDAASLSQYLNKNIGTSRTVGFGGQDATTLKSNANNFERVSSSRDVECGAMAIRFADQNFKWRSGSNRVYVNFTDEPNQPNRIAEYSVESFNSQNTGYSWSAQKGTVHTVFSGSVRFSNTTGYEEFPWLISDYTGGTIKYASSDFENVTLLDLPVTGALQNSYIIYFLNIEQFKDGQYHTVHITIRDSTGTLADKTFKVRFV